MLPVQQTMQRQNWQNLNIHRRIISGKEREQPNTQNSTKNCKNCEYCGLYALTVVFVFNRVTGLLTFEIYFVLLNISLEQVVCTHPKHLCQAY